MDRRQVELYCEQMTEEVQRLQTENSELGRSFQETEKELKDYKDREKTIRNVLLNAHKTVEMMKANAEKEARLIVAEAELKAEKILQGAHQRLAQLHGDISELKRHRIQLETKLRSTIQTYQQLLDMDKEDEKESEIEDEVKFQNR